jgi:hypothetical protein
LKVAAFWAMVAVFWELSALKLMNAVRYSIAYAI